MHACDARWHFDHGSWRHAGIPARDHKMHNAAIFGVDCLILAMSLAGLLLRLSKKMTTSRVFDSSLPSVLRHKWTASA